MKYRFILILLFIILLGAILRFWTFNKTELVHWDEGVYALVGRWWRTGGNFGIPPNTQIKYAPPLFPILVSISFLIFGESAKSAVLISILSGVLSIYMIFLLGKTLFGQEIGLISALFFSVCEYSIIYSKLAITDSTFLLFFLLAIYYLYRAVNSSKIREFITFGILGGMLINIKYCGFFPLVIGITYIFFQMFLKKNYKKFKITLMYMIFSLIILVMTFLPWILLIIQSKANMISHFSYFSLGSYGIFRSTPQIIIYYLFMWISFPILILFLIGFINSLFKLNSENLLLVIWFILYFVSLLFYFPYPRLVLPLIPPLLIFSSIGLFKLAELLKCNFKIIFLIFISILIAAFSTYSSLETIFYFSDSYRLAGNLINEKTPLNAAIFLRTQANLPFYLNRKIYALNENKDLDSQIKNLSKPVYIVFDIVLNRNSLLYKSVVGEKKLKEVSVIENNLHDDVYLNNFSLSLFRKLKVESKLKDKIYIFYYEK